MHQDYSLAHQMSGRFEARGGNDANFGKDERGGSKV